MNAVNLSISRISFQSIRALFSNRFNFVETDTTRLDNIIGGTNLRHIVRHDLTGWRAFVKV